MRLQSRGIGWTRRGTDVCYYQNSIRRKGGYYYTATFSLVFEHAYDTVYIAHSYPYTFTDLQRYLRALENDPKRLGRFRRRPLCRTLAGNFCDVITITSTSTSHTLAWVLWCFVPCLIYVTRTPLFNLWQLHQ